MIFNLIILEHRLDIENSLFGMYFPKANEAKKCQPLQPYNMVIIQFAFNEANDEIRGLILLIRDNELKLAEV